MTSNLCALQKCSSNHFRNVAEDFPLKALSVIRQKDESQNGRYKETKHTKFSEKRPPVNIRACTHQVVKNVSFLENLVIFFLVTPVWRFSYLIFCRQFFLYTIFYCCFSLASDECTWNI